MKKNFLSLFLFPVIVFAQNNFKKGYLIDKQNNKIECLIKDEDWLNNPEFINVKSTETAETTQKSALEMNEFGITDQFRYVLAKTNLDISPKQTSELDKNYNPNF